MNLKHKIMKLKKIITSAFFTLAIVGTSFATEKDPIKKKKETKEIKTIETIVGVAAANKNFTTLVAAVKAAGLVDVLNSKGLFTVFAPTNDAFDKLPEGTVSTLLKKENLKTLSAILTYHVVAGKFKAKEVIQAIKDNNGKFVIKTVQGNNLTATIDSGKVILTDAKGGKSTIILTDVEASNGVIHAIDTVVMPQ